MWYSHDNTCGYNFYTSVLESTHDAWMSPDAAAADDDDDDATSWQIVTEDVLISLKIFRKQLRSF